MSLYLWPVFGICLAMVDGLVCVFTFTVSVSLFVACVGYCSCHGGWACVCVPVNVNTVLFIWLVLACVVRLAGT